MKNEEQETKAPLPPEGGVPGSPPKPAREWRFISRYQGSEHRAAVVAMEIEPLGCLVLSQTWTNAGAISECICFVPGARLADAGGELARLEAPAAWTPVNFSAAEAAYAAKVSQE